MASTSVPRSRNSRATSWIAGSDSVTRTVPSPPTISASRRARSAPPLRFARACGLTMTPMPGTLGRGARRGELPAGGLDVLPPALADGRVHAVVAQDRLEAHDPLARARDEARPRERIERDQVHLGAEPVQEAHEPAGVRLAVVLVAQHDVLEGDALAARERQRAAGVEERTQWVAAVDGHQPRALRVGGGGERHGQVDARLGEQAPDHGDEADGGDRDAPGRDGVAPLGGQDVERRAHRLVVGERLTHAHEDDVRERARRGERAAGAHLAHDLGWREVAHEAHARRRAEAAPHPAARLARDAEREPVARASLALELRDEDALDRGGTRGALTREVEEELPRAVGGVGDEDGGEAAEREVGGEAGTQPPRQVRHAREAVRALAVHPGEDLRRAVARLARTRTPRLELGAGQVLDLPVRHGGILASGCAARHACFAREAGVPPARWRRSPSATASWRRPGSTAPATSTSATRSTAACTGARPTARCRSSCPGGAAWAGSCCTPRAASSSRARTSRTCATARHASSSPSRARSASTISRPTRRGMSSSARCAPPRCRARIGRPASCGASTARDGRWRSTATSRSRTASASRPTGGPSTTRITARASSWRTISPTTGAA